MKILNLNLKAFGPFTDSQLDLSGGDNGLHIVYGPNETGKSSSLRAITDLLYGFNSRTPDDFIHAYRSLRVGAELQHSDGTTLEIVRRKANKKSLFNADDSKPLDEAELTNFLGDVDRELFQMMFGIDHERLRRGGEQIAKGDGRIGELLFAAGAGLVGLQNVQTKLQEEKDALLKVSGRSGSIVTGIKEYQEGRKAVKESQISVDTWKRHDDSLRAANVRKDKLDEAIAKNRSEQNRLIRIKDAIASIGKWKKAKEDLALVNKTPLVADDFDKNATQLMIDLSTAEQQKTDAEGSIKKIDDELSQIDIPEQLLQESEAAESLRDRLGGYRKAMADRPGLETSRALAENEAKEILRELGRAADLSEIEDLRLPTDKTVRIQNLGIQQEGLAQKVQATRRECEKIRAEITRIESAIADIQIPDDAESLRSTVREIQSEGDLEAQLEAATEEVTELQENGAIGLQQLGLWSGSLETVEKLAVPSLPGIEQYAGEMKDKTRQIDSLRGQLKDKQNQRAQLETQLKQLELGQRVPTEEQLQNARQLREQGLQLVLDEQNGGSTDDADVRAFLKQLSPLTDLTAAYRRSVEQADQIADQLRSDADRVATKANIQADIEQQQSEASGLQQQLKDAEDELLNIEASWQATWAPLSIEPASPLEMRDWLRKQQELAKIGAEIRTKKTEETRLAKRVEAMVGETTRVLSSIAPSQKTDNRSLRELLRSAASKCDDIQKSESLLEQLTDDLQTNKDDLADAESRFSESETEWADWQANWAAEMGALGLQDDAMPSQANSVLSNVDRLFQKFQQSDQLRLQLEGIDREAKEFDTDVQDLIGRTVPELADKPIEDAVGLLSTELKAVRSAEENRTSLIARRNEYAQKAQKAVERITNLKTPLDEMCRQAECETYEQLSEAANKSRQRRTLEDGVRELEQLISQQSGGGDFDAFIQEAQSVDVDSLQPQIDTLAEETERLGIERDEVIGLIKAESIELRKIDGSSQAAENVALCESVASRLEEQVRDLAKLRMCTALLNAAIEEHRKKNQGPVLGRASEIFNRITLGAFKELRADYNEQGDPVLTGVRDSTDAAIPVAGMSDGTCDQLYLALRLASLESWLDRHEPIPFIVDDVLLNFDDGRAIASLEVLAELSHRTQVVFFTHHQHMVDMATNNLPKSDVFVATISGRTTT